MFLEEAKATVSLDISVENDLEVDANGNFYLVNLLFVEEQDEPAEIRISFEEVIENVMDFYRDDPTSNIGYGQMYAIANELERHAVRLRELAGYMEGDATMDDLFADDPYESPHDTEH